MEDVLVPIVVVPVVFGSGVWVVSIIVNFFRMRSQARLVSDLQTRLLERIGSAREFGEFLNTEGGRKMVDSLLLDSPDLPHRRILRAVQSGAVLAVAGIGFDVALMFAAHDDWPRGLASDLFLLANTVIAIGIGLMISGAISYFMSRRLGLIDNRDEPRAGGAVPSI